MTRKISIFADEISLKKVCDIFHLDSITIKYFDSIKIKFQADRQQEKNHTAELRAESLKNRIPLKKPLGRSPSRSHPIPKISRNGKK